MADKETNDRLDKISNDIDGLADKLATKNKDVWDRLSALSPFVSGVLIAGVGLYFTVGSQNRQIEINEVDLAVKFFPYLTSDNNDTRAQAFSVIQALGGNLLITRLAPLGGKAAEQALITVQKQSSDPEVKKSASEALISVRSVAEIQKALGVTPNGVLGDATREAIARFQASKGLDASGLIDARTLNMIQAQIQQSSDAAR